MCVWCVCVCVCVCVRTRAWCVFGVCVYARMRGVCVCVCGVCVVCVVCVHACVHNGGATTLHQIHLYNYM